MRRPHLLLIPAFAAFALAGAVAAPDPAPVPPERPPAVEVQSGHIQGPAGRVLRPVMLRVGANSRAIGGPVRNPIAHAGDPAGASSVAVVSLTVDGVPVLVEFEVETPGR